MYNERQERINWYGLDVAYKAHNVRAGNCPHTMSVGIAQMQANAHNVLVEGKGRQQHFEISFFPPPQHVLPEKCLPSKESSMVKKGSFWECVPVFFHHRRKMDT